MTNIHMPLAASLIWALGLGAACGQTGPVTSGLSLWLKADVGLAADGSSWADQSGLGHNATALSGQAPTVKQHGLNGLPVAVFAGNQVMSVAGQLVPNQHFTIVAVATDTSTPGGSYHEIISNWDSSTQTSSIFLGTVWGTVSGQTVDRFRFTDAIGGEDQGQTGQGELKKPAKAFIVGALAAKKQATLRLAKKLEYKLAGGLPTRNLSEPWVIGRQGSLTSEYWMGDIAEILVYDRPLKASEYATDVAYLEAKW